MGLQEVEAPRIFRQSAHGGKVSPTHRPPFSAPPPPTEYIPGTYLGCGPGSSVGIATDYGLDGPGSNPGGEEIFPPV